MPLKSARRLPRKYNRPTSAKTRALAERRTEKKKKWRKDRFRRWFRRVERSYLEWQKFVIRWLLVGFAAVLVFAFGFLIFSPVVSVREIHIVRTDPRLDIESVQQALAPLFNRHTMFLSEFEVRSLLKQAIPDLDTVEVAKMYPSELRVSVKLDPIIARLDILDPEQERSTATGAWIDYITNEGMYIATNATYEEEFPIIQLVDWGARPQPGERVISVDLLERMDAAGHALVSQFGYTILSNRVYMRSQEFHLQVEGYSLWFDMRSSLADHLLRYRTLLNAVGPENVNQYIDLRLTDRLVYK